VRKRAPEIMKAARKRLRETEKARKRERERGKEIERK